MASKINLKPSKKLVYAIGGLGEIETPMVLNTKMRLSSSMRVLNPEDDLLGINYVIPDYSYIVENADRVKALVITYLVTKTILVDSFLLKQANIPILCRTASALPYQRKIGRTRTTSVTHNLRN